MFNVQCSIGDEDFLFGIFLIAEKRRKGGIRGAGFMKGDAFLFLLVFRSLGVRVWAGLRYGQGGGREPAKAGIRLLRIGLLVFGGGSVGMIDDQYSIHKELYFLACSEMAFDYPHIFLVHNWKLYTGSVERIRAGIFADNYEPIYLQHQATNYCTMRLYSEREEDGFHLHQKLKESLTRNQIPYTEQEEEDTIVVYISLKHNSNHIKPVQSI